MTDRFFVVLLVAVFILVLGGTGALTNGAPVGVPPAEAIVPAGDDDLIDLDELDCEELLELNFDIIAGEVHKGAINLEELQALLAECINGGSPSIVDLQERMTSGTPFTLNLSGGGNFVAVSGIIDPLTGEYTGQGVGTVGGFTDVTVTMVMTIAADGSITGTYTMGAAGELPGGVAAVYAVTGTFPLKTPTPTPSPTDTPVPTATPTAAPGQQVTWADNNCKDGVNPVDSLLVLRADAGLSANTNECPALGSSIDVLLASPHIWGNVDCKDGMTPVDSLKILRYDAGLSITQEPACPEMGSEVTITLS